MACEGLLKIQNPSINPCSIERALSTLAIAGPESYKKIDVHDTLSCCRFSDPSQRIDSRLTPLVACYTAYPSPACASAHSACVSVCACILTKPAIFDSYAVTEFRSNLTD